MIPKLIHRIWLEEEQPRKVKYWGVRWSSLHPDWNVIDWQDPEKLPLLVNQKLYSDAKKWYPDDWKRFRADIVRLELLWWFGGVYVDADTEPLMNLETLIDNAACLVGRSPQSIKGVHPISNAFIAAEPRHLFVGECIKKLPASMKRFGHKGLAKSAGPWHLTRVYESRKWPDVEISDKVYDESYFIHHWSTLGRRQGRSLD